MGRIEPNSEMEQFMAFIKNAGFTECPICKNKDDFTWAHKATIPGMGSVQMTAFIPGTTTLPGDSSGKTESFTTPLYILVCDNCTFVMPFSKTKFAYKSHEK